MSLRTCNEHDIIASKRCPVCHKPLCIHCKTKDGCCSEKCFISRQKFGRPTGGAPPRRGRSALGALVKLALLVALACGVAHFLGISLPFDLPLPF